MVFTPKFEIIMQKKDDFIFLGVNIQSETVRSTVDVIREAEKERTSDQ